MKKIIKSFAIILVVIFGSFIFLLSTHIGGWRAFVVMSPSMEPAISTGSLVITHQINPKSLKASDVITFIRPDKTREFITHRIKNITQNGAITIIKTKGDKNKSQDNWVLAGGGVVGKVIYTIPQLGYLLSLSKTKLGIVLLIIIPAIFIIFDEFNTIFTLVKDFRKKKFDVSQAAVIILFFSGLVFFTPQPTHALLSDSVSLTGNTFTVIKPISKKTCGGNTAINITNNGAGSSNNVNISSDCSTNINQTNSSTITTTVLSDVSTGGNKTTDSTGNSTITTSESISNISVTTNSASNSVELIPILQAL